MEVANDGGFEPLGVDLNFLDWKEEIIRGRHVELRRAARAGTDPI